jgi:phosphopantetheinyl transferase
MGPAYELLWLTDAATSDSGLRALTRAHPEGARAAYVSRSYRAPLALVAWHEAPVGVDIERVESTERDFAESICTPNELRQLGARLDDEAFVTSLWASKEALAKALGDAVAYDPRRLESPFNWAGGIAGGWCAREFIPAPHHIAWLVWSEPRPSHP